MLTFSTIPLFAASRLLLSLVAPSSLVGAVPRPEQALFTNATFPNATASASGSSGYWLANIQRQGTVAFGNSNFQIYRNIKDFGAVGKSGRLVVARRA